MDRNRGQGSSRPLARCADPAGTLAVPSRESARAALRSALEVRGAMVLLTGDAGAGKSWLWRSIQAASTPDARWLRVDLSPGVEPSGLIPAIAHALDLGDPGDSPLASTRAIEQGLAERSAEGERWVLVVEEAHNASAAMLEELRVLGNRLGQDDWFASAVLVGQTPLARRLLTRPLNPLRSRIAERVHLRPLDVEEAGLLLRAALPGRAVPGEAIESLHRDAAGNPQALLRLAASRVWTADAVLPPPAPRPVIAPPAERLVEPIYRPERPPLVVGDGMVEVGWEPPAEPARELEAERDELPASPPPRIPDEAPAERPVRIAPRELPVPPQIEGEVAIDDHYAALQAWNEWSASQPEEAVAEWLSASDSPRGDAAVAGGPSGRPVGPNLRAEGQHAFAPYSQLFSRLRRASDVE